MNKIEEHDARLNDLQDQVLHDAHGDGNRLRLSLANGSLTGTVDDQDDQTAVVHNAGPHKASGVNVPSKYDGYLYVPPSTTDLTTALTMPDGMTVPAGTPPANNAIILCLAESATTFNNLPVGDYNCVIVGSVSDGGSPPTMLTVVTVDGPALGTEFPITLSYPAGDTGSLTTQCAYTYTVTNTLTGLQLGTAVDPTATPHLWRRATLGYYIAATAGRAYINASGAYVITWTNEVADQEACP